MKREHFQRARSEAEKSDRRAAILQAAGAHISDVGVDGFTMTSLAKAAGLAKGTLYLYFTTREELLLALFAEAVTGWADRLLNALKPGVSDAAFVALFRETIQADPLFLPLAAQLTTVLEQNAAAEQIFTAKRAMAAAVFPVVGHVEACLGLPDGAGMTLGNGLMALLVGATQMGSKPDFGGIPVPEDVQAIMDGFDCDDLFSSVALLMITGLRR